MKTLDQKSVENLFESCTLLSNHRRKPKKTKIANRGTINT